MLVAASCEYLVCKISVCNLDVGGVPNTAEGACQLWSMVTQQKPMTAFRPEPLPGKWSCVPKVPAGRIWHSSHHPES